MKRSDLKKNRYDYILEIISLLSLVGIITVIVLYYQNIPEIIPIHYNLELKPDSYGHKIFLWIIPIISVISYAGLTVLYRYPNIYNYPISINVGNEVKLHTIGRRLVLTLKMLTTSFFFYIHGALILPFIPFSFIIFFGFILLITITPIFSIIKMVKAKK